jgi:hypothetical protein
MVRIVSRLFLLRDKGQKANKHKAMTEQEAKERFAEMKAKLKAAQELLDSLDNVDENNIPVQSATLLEIARLQQEVAIAAAEIDRLQGFSSRKK